METLMKRTKSAGGVVVNKKGEVLVVNQRGVAWSLPKGHIDPGEDAIKTAKREINEESGIAESELKLIKKLGKYQRYKISKDGTGEDKSELKEIEMFLFTTEQMSLKPIDKHNPEARWVSKNKVAALLTHHKDKEFYESVAGEI